MPPGVISLRNLAGGTTSWLRADRPEHAKNPGFIVPILWPRAHTLLEQLAHCNLSTSVVPEAVSVTRSYSGSKQTRRLRITGPLRTQRVLYVWSASLPTSKHPPCNAVGHFETRRNGARAVSVLLCGKVASTLSVPTPCDAEVADGQRCRQHPPRRSVHMLLSRTCARQLTLKSDLSWLYASSRLSVAPAVNLLGLLVTNLFAERKTAAHNIVMLYVRLPPRHGQIGTLLHSIVQADLECWYRLGGVRNAIDALPAEASSCSLLGVTILTPENACCRSVEMGNL